MATHHPATAMGRPDLGHITIGGPADLTLLKLVDAPLRFVDVLGQERIGSSRLSPCGAFAAGQYIESEPRDFESL